MPEAAGGSSRRIPELDGLRGLAILLVLIWHYGACLVSFDQGPLVGAFKQAASLTWSGVDLFFVLSGFLIGGILIEHRDAPAYYRTFYVRRACRILPPYFAVLIVAFGWAALGAAQSIAWLFESLLPAWSYATFTQNLVMAHHNTFGADALGITWSLAVEEQFYLVLPLLVRVLPRAHLVPTLAATVLAAPLLRVGLYHYHANGSFPGYVLMPARADALMLGVLAAVAFAEPEVRRRLAAHRSGLYGLLGVLLAGTALLTARGPGVGPGTSFEMSYLGHTWLALLYLCALVIALVEQRGPTTWLLRKAWLRRLGLVSYTVYLLHQLVSGVVHGLLLGQRPHIDGATDLAATALALALTLGIAALSWRLFEGPIVAWGHRFLYTAERRAGSGAG